MVLLTTFEEEIVTFAGDPTATIEGLRDLCEGGILRPGKYADLHTRLGVVKAYGHNEVFYKSADVSRILGLVRLTAHLDTAECLKLERSELGVRADVYCSHSQLEACAHKARKTRKEWRDLLDALQEAVDSLKPYGRFADYIEPVWSAGLATQQRQEIVKHSIVVYRRLFDR